MNLGVCTSRRFALRTHAVAAAVLLVGLFGLPLLAQSPQAVEQDGRVVWTNDNPNSTDADGPVYWSESEQRWKPVRAASPRPPHSARAVANDGSSSVALQPQVDPADPKASADAKGADNTPGKGAPAASSIYFLIPPHRATTAAAIDRHINEAAARHHVDPNLVRALIKVESNFNPRALSSKGAMGLMQLMPATARLYDVTDPFDAAQNVDAGVRHLKGLLENFRGDVSLTLAAYNAGQGAVERNGGIPPYTETRNYVRRITGLMASGISLTIPEPVIASTSMSSDGTSMPIDVRRDERGVLMISNTD